MKHYHVAHTRFWILTLAIVFMGAACSKTEKAERVTVDNVERVFPGMEATLRAFIGLARADWTTAMNMMATPEMAQQWGDRERGLFQHPIEPAAFFAQPILLVSAQYRDRWVGGVYNLWMDQWLLLQFQWMEPAREYRVIRYAWVAPPEDDALETVEIARFADAAQARLRRALDTGAAAAQALLDGGGLPHSLPPSTAGRHLRMHIERLRDTLAPDGAAALADLRAAVATLGKDLTEGRLTDEIGPLEWADSMFASYLVSQESRHLVVMASPEDPFTLVVGEFESGAAKIARKDVSRVRLHATQQEDTP